MREESKYGWDDKEWKDWYRDSKEMRRKEKIRGGEKREDYMGEIEKKWGEWRRNDENWSWKEKMNMEKWGNRSDGGGEEGL